MTAKSLFGTYSKDNAFVQENTGADIWNGDCVQLAIEDFQRKKEMRTLQSSPR